MSVRHHDHPSTPDSVRPEDLDLLLDDDGEPVSPGPGEVVLPIHYRAVGAADVGDTVTVLPCSHWFHHECIRAWLGEHDTCPHCRKGIMPRDPGTED